MELALTITAGVGALLFLIGYLGFVVTGFKHHFVTGIISILPVLNIVTVPALWYKSAKKIMMSTLGIIIVAASWFMGADVSIKNTLAKLQGKNTPSIAIGSGSRQVPLNINNVSGSNATTISANPLQKSTPPTSTNPYIAKQHYIDESNVIPLPGKALYSMHFEAIPLNNISTIEGKIVQIVMRNETSLEGKVVSTSNSSILIESRESGTNELPIANIKQLRLMVKRAN